MAESRTVLHTRNTPALPANNGYSVIFDTTRWTDSVCGAVTATAAAPTPGENRGFGKGRKIQGTFGCTAEDVTLYKAFLDGAGNFVQADSDTITAGDAAAFEWDPKSGDWILYIKAGAAAPSALACELTILEE